jgi:hypothetical protein
VGNSIAIPRRTLCMEESLRRGNRTGSKLSWARRGGEFKATADDTGGVFVFLFRRFFLFVFLCVARWR